MKKKEIIFLTLLTVLFFFLSITICFEKSLGFDTVFYNVLKLFINNEVTVIFKGITFLGSFTFFFVICLALIAFIKRKKYAFLITLNLVNTAIINNIFKLIIVRERPLDINLIIEKGYSFPSGHAMGAMSFYGFLIYLVNCSNFKKITKNILTILCSLIIITIGLSRVYLGVHYFTDVLAGFILSAIYLIVFINLIEKDNFTELKRFIKSVNNAFAGIISSIKTEKNMIIHFIIMLIVIVMGFILKISYLEWCLCIIIFGLVISGELINTAIETTVDLAMPKIHPKAKLAKDIAAGSVLVLAITAIVIGLIIFIPKILILIK